MMRTRLSIMSPGSLKDIELTVERISSTRIKSIFLDRPENNQIYNSSPYEFSDNPKIKEDDHHILGEFLSSIHPYLEAKKKRKTELCT